MSTHIDIQSVRKWFLHVFCDTLLRYLLRHCFQIQATWKIKSKNFNRLRDWIQLCSVSARCCYLRQVSKMAVSAVNGALRIRVSWREACFYNTAGVLEEVRQDSSPSNPSFHEWHKRWAISDHEKFSVTWGSSLNSALMLLDQLVALELKSVVTDYCSIESFLQMSFSLSVF